MNKPIIISFRYSYYRKSKSKFSNFNVEISDYWDIQFKKMFKGW